MESSAAQPYADCDRPVKGLASASARPQMAVRPFLNRLRLEHNWPRPLTLSAAAASLSASQPPQRAGLACARTARTGNRRVHVPTRSASGGRDDLQRDPARDAPFSTIRQSGPIGAPTSQLHMVERFTRVDAETIYYEAALTDPTCFTRSWTVRFPLSQDQSVRGVAAAELFEFACHEGNYAITNVLRGARAQDEEVK